MITLNLNDDQERELVELITANPTPTLLPILDEIKREREWERWNEHCNVDCARFRAGTCPYPHNEHHLCPRYQG